MLWMPVVFLGKSVVRELIGVGCVKHTGLWLLCQVGADLGMPGTEFQTISTTS